MERYMAVLLRTCRSWDISRPGNCYPWDTVPLVPRMELAEDMALGRVLLQEQGLGRPPFPCR